jgi:hypothetical protein
MKLNVLRCYISTAGLVVLLAWSATAIGQLSSTAGKAKSASPATDTPSAGDQFAIESEMLTYGSLESDSESVACALAQRLGTAQNCKPVGVAAPTGIVLVSSASNALGDYQLWRSDMATMTLLEARAKEYCGKDTERSGSETVSAASLLPTPAGEALSLAQMVLATNEATSTVEGNILDQTMMNDLAGHLREFSVPVLMPEIYMPLSLKRVDNTASPFMKLLTYLLVERRCLGPAKTDHNAAGAEKYGGQAGGTGTQPSPGAQQNPGTQQGPPAQQSPAAQQNQGQQPSPGTKTDDGRSEVAADIDDFVKTLTSGAPAPAKSAGGTETAPPAAPAVSHLASVLRADGLAQEMEGSGGHGVAWDLLWIKALESGGTVLKSGNALLGTKTRYSGGAVGTYALFSLDGEPRVFGGFLQI